MRLLLDTSAYSGFMRGNLKIKTYIQEAEIISVNAVVLGELRAGFLHGKKREKNEELLRRFLLSPRTHVLPVEEETADRYAVIMNALWTLGKPIPTNDIWIAATAMQFGLEILTMDVHFQYVPQVLVHHITSE
ncbi:MAG: ribonuclease VapC [Nitrospirales bacterium]|nr:MAG: ribonuclease VapC [Nitrospirales bacterium]